MEQAKRIRWNSFFSLLSSGIRLLANVLLFLGVARFYGPEAFGQFTTAHTLSTLFYIFADFGLDVLLTTEVARRRGDADRLFRSFFAAKLSLAGFAVIGMGLIALTFDFSAPTRWLIFIFSFSVVFNALTYACFALFKGFEQLQYETQGTFVFNLLLLVALVLLGILRAPIWMIAVAFTGTRALGFIMAAKIAKRLVRLQPPRFGLAEFKDVMRRASVFGMHLIFEMLYFQSDTLLLSWWQGDYAVGIYQAVMKLVILILVLPDVAINALLPVLSRLHAEDELRSARLGGLLNKTLWLLGLPVALIFFVYADDLIAILYGREQFAPAIPIMKIAGLVIITRFFFAAYGVMFATSGRQQVRMFIMIGATIFSLALNAYAIPRYGAYGAILVSLTANLFVAAAFILASRSLFVQWTFNLNYILPGALTLILAFMLWKSASWPIWYGLPGALILYAGIFYFIGYNKNERQMVFGGMEALAQKQASVI
jgi:O-antigen/teichoic acid export membrane protein